MLHPPTHHVPYKGVNGVCQLDRFEFVKKNYHLIFLMGGHDMNLGGGLEVLSTERQKGWEGAGGCLDPTFVSYM